MKKFTAKELIDRAYDLADIKNTDFLTHEENTQYINDAWKMVYQWLINKGDKQFIKEVQLTGTNFHGVTEYLIPDDLYQIAYLKDTAGHVIPRKAISESETSNTYEVYNDRIRLYGVTNNVTLGYYLTPVWITYPNESKDLDLENYDIISTCKNTALLENGVIKNILTGETLGSVDISLGNYILGNGHLVCDRSLGDTGLNNLYYNFSGGNLGQLYTYDIQNIMKDYDGNLCYDKGYFIGGKPWKGGLSEYYKGKGIKEADITYLLRYNIWFLGWHFVLGQKGTDNFNGFIVYTPNGRTDVSFYEGTSVATNNWDFVNNFVPIDKNHVFIKDSLKGGFMLEVTDDYEITLTQVEDTEYPIILAGLKDYYITSNGSYTQLESNIEDTEFNFPNEIYIELLSCDLAIRYAMKMNADPTGLNNQYEAMKNTFMNTLSQDSGYTRITKVY